MKTRARVSFIIDLDKLNSQRKLNGKALLTEQEFFNLISDKEAVIMHHTSKETILTSVELQYIVV